MAVQPIPDAHHVVRHCKKRLLERKDGVVIGVLPEAFHLRPATSDREQEQYLSAIYFEYFAGSHADRMRACRDALPFVCKPKDGLVRLCVGTIKDQGKQRNIPLRVTHEGTQRSPAYAAIRGLPFNPDDELTGLLSAVAVLETLEVSTL